MFKIQQNKEKLVLVLVIDEQDESLADIIKKFKNTSDYKNALKDFKVNVIVNGTMSEFSTEVQPGEDLEECMQRLRCARLAIYNLLYQLEKKEDELPKKEEADTCPFDKLLDKCEVMVVIIPNHYDND